jgi:dTDP-glucose 4,6-dehydratase
VGKSLEIEIDEKRVRPTGSEVDRLLADNTKAQALLGWKPAVSLEEGLVRTIEWLERHLNRYRPGVYAI